MKIFVKSVIVHREDEGEIFKVFSGKVHNKNDEKPQKKPDEKKTAHQNARKWLNHAEYWHFTPAPNCS